MARKEGEKRLTPNPKFEDLRKSLDMVMESLKRYGTLMAYSPEQTRNIWAQFSKDLRANPITLNLYNNMKNRGMSDIKFVNYLNNNFDRITGAKSRTYQNGEIVPLGRPRKENKAEKPKAERYKSIYAMRKDGYVNLSYIKSLTYDDIRKLTLKEAQRIAYYMQENIKRRDKALKAKGYTDTAAQRIFKNNGGFLPSIISASANSLKSFIKRGNLFLSAESSTTRGVKNIRSRVSEAIKRNTGVDISKFTSTENDYDLFWGAVHTAERSGLSTVLGKDKYEIMNLIDYYLQGNEFDEEDINLQNMLDAWIMDRAGKSGIYLDSKNDVRNYLAERYSSDASDLDDYV